MNTDLLFELSDARGPVGYEDAVRDVVRRELDAYADRVRTDAMGNVVGTIEGTSDEEVLVAAHMDEIGFMVEHITDEGFLRVDALGGWNPEILRAQPVAVLTDDGPVSGIIGAEPAHTRDEDEFEDVDDVAVDLGRDAEEVADLVSVGDVVTLDVAARELGDCVVGKALDDRAGVWAIVEAGRRVAAADPEATVHIAATVQEEVGLRGAAALGVDVDPDLAIAVDGTLERSVPGVGPADRVTKLGDGVGIKAKDATVLPTPAVVDWLRETATREGVDFQVEVASNIGTDAGALQNVGGARPIGGVSIPVRYHHSPVELAHREDLAAAVDLLATALVDPEASGIGGDGWDGWDGGDGGA